MLGTFSFIERLKALAVLSAVCAVLMGAHPDDEEEVTASKIQLRDWIPTAYSVVSLRQYNEEIAKSSDPAGILQLRYSLGAKFLDEKLDTSLTLAVNKRYETKEVGDEDTVSQRLPEFFASYQLVDLDLLSVDPYTTVRFPVGDNKLAVSLGGVIKTGYDMNIAGGKMSIGGGVDLWATQSEYTDTEVETDSDTNLTSLKERPGIALKENDEGVTETLTKEEDYLRYGSDYGIWASYEPEILDGLSIGLSSTYQVRYIPEFSADGDDIERSGYDTGDKVENSISVSYNITDDLSISNNFYYYVDGFFEKATASGELRSLNRIMISYTLL